MKAIDLINIHLHYGAGRDTVDAVLSGANLQVDDGDIVGLLGASGAGKSTLLRVVAGLQQPLAGTVIVAGQTTDDGGMRPCHRICETAPWCFKTPNFSPTAPSLPMRPTALKLPKFRVPSVVNVLQTIEMVQISEPADRA